MIGFEYVLRVAWPVLFLQTQLVLMWDSWTGEAFVTQGERVRRAVFLAWGGILVLFALIISFNFTETWSRIPTDMAEGGQLAWAANLAAALLFLVSDRMVVVAVVRRWNRRRQYQETGV
jgi:hypothetical protein